VTTASWRPDLMRIEKKWSFLIKAFSSGISETVSRLFVTGSSSASTWQLGHQCPTLSLEYLSPTYIPYLRLPRP
jgi:hypothetical protein